MISIRKLLAGVLGVLALSVTAAPVAQASSSSGPLAASRCGRASASRLCNRSAFANAA